MGNQIDRLFGYTTPQFQGALNYRPYTDSERTIFPWDHRSRTFSTSESGMPYSSRSMEALVSTQRSQRHEKGGNPTLQETSSVIQELSKSEYYDPNLDFLTCLTVMFISIMCLLCILVPVFTVLLAASTSTNWLVWILALIILLAIVLALSYYIYRSQLQSEEGRMIQREQDFARRLDKINKRYRERGEQRSWETGPRGAYLQFNKNRDSKHPVVVNSPVVPPRLF